MRRKPFAPFAAPVIAVLAAIGLLLGIPFAAAPALAAAPSAAPAAPFAPVPGDVQDFSFASLDSEYTLTRADDGTSRVRVVETFVAVFPQTDQNRGIQRRIPEWFRSAPMHPELVSVTDQNGDPRPVETDSDDGHLIVTSRADEFLRGQQTFVITYDLVNVTPFYSDTGVDEFYVDVNGVDWAQPFGRVSATLLVDPAIAGSLTGAEACYRGVQGSTDTCATRSMSTPDGGAVVQALAYDLAPHETATIAVAFEAGTFVQFDASYFASGWGWAQAGGVLLVVGGFISALVVRRRVLKDEPGRPTIIAEYAPPEGIDALEAAILLGKTTKAIPAEVLEQAVVGSIRIVEGKPKAFGGTKLEAHLVDASRADGDGRMLLAGLFGDDVHRGMPDRTVYVFGSSDTRLSTASAKILKAARAELKRRGLWRRVSAAARVLPVVILAVAVALVVAFGVIAVGEGVTAWLPVGLLIATVLAAIFGFGTVAHQPLTARGAEVRDHLRGLKIFIEWAEADRIRMLQSPSGAERRPVDVGDPRQMLHLYETLLPYAVVFGQEKQWAQQLAVYYGDQGSPGWYVGTTGFSAAAFSSGISSLSASSAAASSSGGSSGGGSAGGGGGGGGGGGV